MAHADIKYYVLINEEKQFDAHKNLDAPKTSHYDGTTKYFNFDVPSIVKTLEGSFAGGNPVGGAVMRVLFCN